MQRTRVRVSLFHVSRDTGAEQRIVLVDIEEGEQTTDVRNALAAG
jgi:hypothetical protein